MDGLNGIITSILLFSIQLDIDDELHLQQHDNQKSYKERMDILFGMYYINGQKGRLDSISHHLYISPFIRNQEMECWAQFTKIWNYKSYVIKSQNSDHKSIYEYKLFNIVEVIAGII